MASGVAERSRVIAKAAAALACGDLEAALKLYAKAFDDDPRDWNVGNALGDLYVRMGRTEDASSHFTMLAEQLAADGFTARARALYRKILRLQPNDEAARLRVEELDRQQVGTASPFLKRVLETARTNREATAPVSAPPPAAVPEPEPVVAPPSEPVVALPPETPLSFAEAEATANEAIARRDYHAASAELERFLAVDPSHVEALERLVDISVDGRLEAQLVAAQQRLADACAEAGRFRQAVDIALDLCARQPSIAAHTRRAERIAAAAREHGAAVAIPCATSFDEEQEIDLSQLSARPQAPIDQAVPEPEIPEPIPAVPAASIAIGPPFGDLLKAWSDPARLFDDVQQALLDEAAAHAEEHFAQASRLVAARQLRDAIAPLEDAMCVPHLRATAGSRLARVYRDTGDPVDALELLEWVAEMPPPDEDSGHELAYELALTLEALGQESQALGVYRELLAEVGPSYRDIATRAQRLTAA
jgi:tetratricopeptide (TPR) repeat protein